MEGWGSLHPWMLWRGGVPHIHSYITMLSILSLMRMRVEEGSNGREGCCGGVGFPTSFVVVEGWGSPHPLFSILLLLLLLLLLLQCPKERGGEERGSSPASEQVSMKLKREGATERVMRQ